MKKEKFDIQGMTCSSCSAHIQSAVSKLDGIKKADVNLLTNSMNVEYDETIIDNNRIISEVVDAGYGASLQGNKKEKKSIGISDTIISMKKRLILSICFLIPLMYIAMHHMLWTPAFIKNIFDGVENSLIYVITQFILVLPIIYLNRNYFIVGFKRLFKGSPNMDSLIAIGSTASIIYGVFAMYMIGYGLGHGDIFLAEKYSMDIYFESAGMILTLVTVGKYLETKSKGKTSDAISKLIDLAPKTAIVLRDGKEIEIKTEEIVIGDIIVIKPGASIPVDGEVIEGSSSIDQSSITGESIPVHKNIGDKLVSGTINKYGYLKMRAEKVEEDTTLSQIIKLVEEASSSKAPIAKLADKVSSVFVPLVITIAILATVIWLTNGQNFEFALSIGIAVLVISCPCALGLATPVAIMVGTGKGAQNGILIKSAESLELLHDVDIVVFDKTGTITEGKPKVTEIISKIDEKELIKIVASIEKNSEHPLAEVIIEKAKENNIELIDPSNFELVSGRGIKGNLNETKYIVGNIAFMKYNNLETDEAEKISNEFLSKGKTVIYIATKSDIIGIIAIADTIKPTSKLAIKELKKRNIKTIMLTGDNKVVAEEIGRQIGIDNVISEVLPQDKEREISKLQKQGYKVAFVGDGINDSPALAKADVGLAIGSGTDIAIESADIVLIKNSLLDVVSAIDLSKVVIRNIKMNLFWAFFYNAIGIPVAAGVFYLSFSLKLSPMIGAAAMSLSSVCVVTNALRLKKFKSKYISKEENIMEVNTKTILIEGMQCNHCKMSIEKALNSIDGITNVDVSLEDKKAVIEFSEEIDNRRINEVIKEVGFEVKEIK